MQMSHARTAVIAVALFVLGPLLAHFSVVPQLVGFGIFAAGGALGLIAAILGIVACVRRGFAVGGGNLVIGAVLSAVFLSAALPGRSVPRINDITTDTTNPPVFQVASSLPANAGRDMTYPGETFAVQQRAGYADLTGLSLTESPDQVFLKVQDVARSIDGWEVTGVEPTRRALEGVATSKLFRFQDDFVIEVRPGNAGGSQVEMRSKSRVGRGDVGANAARIRMFFARLKAAAT